MIYKHYKGGLYRHLGAALNATNGSNNEIMVVYQSLATKEIFVRNEKEFFEWVNWWEGDVLKAERRFTVHLK